MPYNAWQEEQQPQARTGSAGAHVSFEYNESHCPDGKGAPSEAWQEEKLQARTGFCSLLLVFLWLLLVLSIFVL